MDLEIKIKEQLKRYSKNISIAAEQGPKHYYGNGTKSIPITTRHDDSWKEKESIVFNYIVAFKYLNNLSTIACTSKEIRQLIPIMEGFREGMISQFEPKPLDSEPLLASGPSEKDYNLFCGRLVFMEPMGIRKTSIRYEFYGPYCSLFGNSIDETTHLFKVVKVTFCPTEKIAGVVAEKYQPQEVGLIHIEPKDLQMKEATNKELPEKKNFFGNLLRRRR